MSHGSSQSSISAPRAGAAVSLLPTYLADARAIQKYSPLTPNGALQLSVAENQMLEDLLVPSLTEFSSYHHGSFPADAIYYQPTHGRESLRQAVATYLKNLLELEQELDPDGLVIGAGCNAVLENLCISLAEPGQGVMIPLPYYAAFDFDLGSRAGLRVVPVPTMEHSGASPQKSSSTVPLEAYYPTRAALDAAKEKSVEEQAIEPRILLLSHPQNPLGICYPPHVIQECIDWCRDNKVHLVSDEIYAGSVYRKEEANFKSALKLARTPSGLGPYIHFVYALSKDFALSGLRVGFLYSENLEIRLPLQKLNDLCCVSSHTQLMVERMLTEKTSSDEDATFWTDGFLESNHMRLQKRGDKWQQCMKELSIPHLSATAGLFCWMDLSEFLPAEGTADEQERALYLELLKDYGLLFTPGRSMHNELPGFFRCVFTAASDQEFHLGLERLRHFVTKKRTA
ncbi:1-aminocyclopropane-1-carboxylate synthase [Nitzschia inconspicua]|uniref:1-aminocyclopropane-1-carboxylate synthase n=1 Tax=Nitzschia inconspicua TaxID=303405 RepID=A0A9K3PAY0_9STRA|nr:1-aminocyclopropane-1-carboxylate synthase [Nitzschia inconspicua]KAG7360006.1 1-aminocyclopropane-1-carboxylate synthase [Nitzschia inconspicua]